MDTLRWLNDDEFPFLTTPFHPPQVYAPPAGCVISIAKNGRIASWSTEKSAQFCRLHHEITLRPPSPAARANLSSSHLLPHKKKPGGGGFACVMNAA
ncbi:FIG00732786: hypothetical protein [Klebsiella pneumoniae ISC21]|nr:FIG00732786: hypothetical protein [Klebsiella pneumoniae ISC21]